MCASEFLTHSMHQHPGLTTTAYDTSNSIKAILKPRSEKAMAPTPVLLPGESQGQGAWWAAVYGVAQSQTLVSDFTFTFTFTYNIIHL